MSGLTRVIPFICVALTAFIPAEAAQAVCFYGGVLDAKTTVPQEYHDADLVVRVRPLSMQNYDDAEGYAVRYRLQVVEQYKGASPSLIWLESRRDSGGFYLEDKDGRIDVSGDYLLFLDRVGPETRNSANRFVVNYSCGQSKLWSETTEDERNYLAAR